MNAAVTSNRLPFLFLVGISLIILSPWATRNFSPGDLSFAVALTIRSPRRVKSKEPGQTEQPGLSILGTFPEAVFGLENDRIIFMNRAAESIFGWPSRQLMNRSLSTLYGSETAFGEVKDAIRRVLKERVEVTLEPEMPCITKKGNELTCRVTLSSLGSKTKRSVIIFEDITERKAIENAIVLAKNELTSIIDAFEDFLFITDENGIIKRVNYSLARRFGTEPRELIGITCRDLFKCGQAETEHCCLFRVKNKLAPAKTEMEIPSLRTWVSPEAYPVYVGGELKLIVYLFRDITEHRRTEQLLRIKDIAIESAIHGIAFCDLKGNIDYCNASFLKMLGIGTLDELAHKNILALAAEKKIQKEIRKAILNRQNWIGQITLRNEKGAFMKSQFSANLVKSGAGNPSCYMFSAIDTSAQEHMREALIRTERLSSLGQLAAGLAHELKNPLAIISSCSQFGLDKVDNRALMSKSLKIIHRSAQRANKLITDLLEFAKPGNLNWQKVNVNEILTNMLQIARLDKSSRVVNLKIDLDESIPLVPGDSGKLGQVFLNLLLNAIQALPKRGHISVQTRNISEQNCLEVEIADDGPGIRHEHLNRIFDPFFTTKDKGTGLGLSICNSIIDHHGGAISAFSRLNKGTKFTVRLPLKHRRSG